jgi:hypothetical protein
LLEQIVLDISTKTCGPCKVRAWENFYPRGPPRTYAWASPSPWYRIVFGVLSETRANWLLICKHWGTLGWQMIYPHFVKMSQEDGNKNIVFLKIFGEVTQETRVRSLPALHPFSTLPHDAQLCQHRALRLSLSPALPPGCASSRIKGALVEMLGFARRRLAAPCMDSTCTGRGVAYPHSAQHPPGRGRFWKCASATSHHLSVHADGSRVIRILF